MGAPESLKAVPVVSVRDLSVVFPTRSDGTLTAVDGASLDACENEFVCIVGPSGCGKSALLRVVAGVESASGGAVEYCGSPAAGPGRVTAMVPVPFDRPRRRDDPEYGRLTASILDMLDMTIHAGRAGRIRTKTPAWTS